QSMILRGDEVLACIDTSLSTRTVVYPELSQKPIARLDPCSGLQYNRPYPGLNPLPSGQRTQAPDWTCCSRPAYAVAIKCSHLMEQVLISHATSLLRMSQDS